MFFGGDAMKKYTRDETEHGVEYYLASEVDALLAQAVQPVQEPKWAMPQGWWIAESTPDALNMWPTSADILLDEALAQPASGYAKKIEELIQERDALRALAQPEERYFCQRCGKPVNLTTIHTCTPPT
jgi:hypothetical protein